MKKLPVPLICLLAAFCFTCNDDGPDLNSQYIIISADEGVGNISMYDFKTRTFTDHVFTLDSKSMSVVFNDVAIDGNYVYALTGYGISLLRKIDLKSGTEVKSVKGIPYKSWMNLYDDKILVSFVALDEEDYSFYTQINVYDQDLVLLDSIVDHDSPEVYDTEVVGDKLFYSISNSHNTGLIKVVDLKNFELTTSIEIPSVCIELIKGRDRQLLAIRSDTVYSINTISLKVVKSLPVLLSASRGHSSCAFNADDNVLFYFRPAAPPAPVIVNLFRLDLATGETTPLTESNVFMDAPIVYDNKMNVILTAGDGLKVISNDGKVLDEVSGLKNISKIFIQ